MLFCPHCGILLLIEEGSSGFGSTLGQRFYCQTCPYVQNIETTIVKKLPFVRKTVDDIFGGANAWANVDKTEVQCPKCDSGEAYYKQIQIRSADEPMTIFYKCVVCSHNWNSN